MRNLLWVAALMFAYPLQSRANVTGNGTLMGNERHEARLPPASRWGKKVLLEPKTIRPSQKILKLRIEAEKKRPEIAEPIVLRLKSTELRPLIAQLSSDIIFKKLNSSENAAFELMRNLEARIDKKNQVSTTTSHKTKTLAYLTLNSSDLSWIDLNKLSQALSYPSLEPYLAASEIRELTSNQSNAQKRWAGHFGPRFNSIRRYAEDWLAANPHSIQMPISMLLPEHMRTLVGRYSPFRGRNCFATALQFADPNIIQEKTINLVREPGHTLALINHDEFSHALWLGYQELNQQQVALGLQFGDLVALVNGAEKNAYTSFKHALVHIADDIYFHKPSKSASSPIEFVRWNEIVQTWQPMLKEFDVRFFRRIPTSKLNEQNSDIAVEKMSWNR